MNFRDFPVWNFRPHFNGLESTFQDDASFQSSGFGKTTGWSIQQNAQRLFTLKMLVKGREVISEIEQFLIEREGPLRGFYIPTFKSDLHLLEDVTDSDVSIFVEKSDFPQKFSQHPGHPFIALIDQEKILPLEIIGTEDTDPTKDRLEFLNPVETDFKKEATIVAFLHFVKLDGSSFEWEYLTDDLAQSTIRFIECPENYSGEYERFHPIYFYRFLQGADAHYLTSYAKDLAVDSEIDSSTVNIPWISQNMTHSEIRKSKDFLDEGLTITLFTDDPDHFLRNFVKAPAPIRTEVSLYLKNNVPDYIDLNSPFYRAEIESVRFLPQGKIEVKLSSVLRANEWQIPRVLIARTCNWMLFEPNTCRVDEAAFQASATIDSVNGFEIQSGDFGSFADGYFALGKVRFGDEIRLIRKHQGSTLTLNLPFSADPTGQSVTTSPGCDKQLGTCSAKFSNQIHFGGFPAIPTKNPQLKTKAVPKPSGGGKK
jgi:hypothetical protein